MNKTHILGIHPTNGQRRTWPKNVVFPLAYRPFGHHWFPAPRNPLQALIGLYGRSDDCR